MRVLLYQLAAINSGILGLNWFDDKKDMKAAEVQQLCCSSGRNVQRSVQVYIKLELR